MPPSERFPARRARRRRLAARRPRLAAAPVASARRRAAPSAAVPRRSIALDRRLARPLRPLPVLYPAVARLARARPSRRRPASARAAARRVRARRALDVARIAVAPRTRRLVASMRELLRRASHAAQHAPQQHADAHRRARDRVARTVAASRRASARRRGFDRGGVAVWRRRALGSRSSRVEYDVGVYIRCGFESIYIYARVAAAPRGFMTRQPQGDSLKRCDINFSLMVF